MSRSQLPFAGPQVSGTVDLAERWTPQYFAKSGCLHLLPSMPTL